jgi:RsiW-degrading membrane proteinase PrsW (M82 family)
MNSLQAGARIVLGLLPVFSFLGALVFLDSYKLVKPRWVTSMLLVGAVAAVSSLFVNRSITIAAGFEGSTLAHYVAPVVEETLKGGVVLLLVARRRIGFLVDAAIIGFAAGTGFAALENMHYFVELGDSTLSLWLIRGFGTALMHGSVTAIMAILAKVLWDRFEGRRTSTLAPAWLAAIVLHSIFNHFFISPNATAVVLLLGLPGFFVLVFHLSEMQTRSWLGAGFDSDAELLLLIDAGTVGTSPVGRYLNELTSRFPPMTVADMLCLLRIRLELSIRAKGILLARQSGFALPTDPEIEERFTELRYLERTIGATGLLALKPIFHMNDRDLWQYNMLVAQ